MGRKDPKRDSAHRRSYPREGKGGGSNGRSTQLEWLMEIVGYRATLDRSRAIPGGSCLGA
jgi:hypothetical protein